MRDETNLTVENPSRSSRGACPSGPPRIHHSLAPLSSFLPSFSLSPPSQKTLKMLLLDVKDFLLPQLVDDDLANLYFFGVMLASALLLAWCGVSYVVWLCRGKHCLPLHTIVDSVFLVCTFSLGDPLLPLLIDQSPPLRSSTSPVGAWVGPPVELLGRSVWLRWLLWPAWGFGVGKGFGG